MNKKISICITGLLGSMMALCQQLPEKILLLDDKITVQVPKEFSPLSGEVLATTYPDNTNKPDGVLTGAAGKVNLTYYFTKTAIDDNGIPGYTDEIISGLKAGNKKITLIDDGILLQDGKNIGYIKFFSKINNKETFNYYFYLSLENRLLLFRFQSPKKGRKQWEKKADEIANSLRVNAA
jgi:hypothetical protein